MRVRAAVRSALFGSNGSASTSNATSAAAAAAGRVSADIVPVCDAPAGEVGSISDSAVLRAIDKTWNCDIDGATHDLAAMAALPRPALHIAEAATFRAVLSGDRRDLAACLCHYDRVIAMTEHHQQQQQPISGHSTHAQIDSSDDCQLVLADAYLTSAALLVLEDRLLKAAWRLRKAWSIYSALYRRVSPAPLSPGLLADSAKFGMGVFLLMLSFVPPVIVRVLEVIGFECDRRRGLRLLDEVSRSSSSVGSVRAPVASLVLLANLLAIPRALAPVELLLAEARPVLDRSLIRWPRGAPFLWMASLFARKCGDAAAGLEHMDRAVAVSKDVLGCVPGMLELDRGCCLAMAFRWRDAAVVFGSLQSCEHNAFRGMCRVLHAACLQLTGDTPAALALLRTMPAESELVGKDRLSVDLARRALARKTGLALFPFELLYLRRDLAHLRREDLRVQLTGLEDAFAGQHEHTREEHAAYLLVHGAMLVLVGSAEAGEAELAEAARESLASPSFKLERHVAAFAHCELAEIAYKHGDKARAKQLLKTAAKHATDDAWQDLILPRMRIALDQLRNESN